MGEGGGGANSAARQLVLCIVLASTMFTNYPYYAYSTNRSTVICIQLYGY